MVTDASFPDRKGLCLREQACAGLGHLSAGCWHGGKGRRLQGARGHGGPLPAATVGPGFCPATSRAGGPVPGAAERLRVLLWVGVLGACRLASLGAGRRLWVWQAQGCVARVGTSVHEPLVLSPEVRGRPVALFPPTALFGPQARRAPSSPLPCGAAVAGSL